MIFQLVQSFYFFLFKNIVSSLLSSSTRKFLMLGSGIFIFLLVLALKWELFRVHVPNYTAPFAREFHDMRSRRTQRLHSDSVIQLFISKDTELAERIQE